MDAHPVQVPCPRPRLTPRIRRAALTAALSLAAAGLAASSASALLPGEIPSHARLVRQECVRPKDFSVIKSGGWFHAYAIKHDTTIPEALSTHAFLHQRSSGSLFSWEVLPDDSLWNPPRSGGWDWPHIWAPHMVEREGTLHLFYTGVQNGVQKIGVQTATSLTPTYPWTAYPGNPLLHLPGVPFTNVGSNQLRDPFVYRNPAGNNWHMLYTSARDLQDHEGIGRATSPLEGGSDPLLGPWSGGAELVASPVQYGPSDPAEGGFTTESASLFQHGGYTYVLFTGDCDPTEAGYQACRSWGGQEIRILVSDDPGLAPASWQYRGTLSKLLGINASLWYAPEYVKDPDTGEEFLGVVRQSESNTTSCSGAPTDSSTIEFRKIVWGPDWRFTLVDPNPLPARWFLQPTSGPGARREQGVAFDGAGSRLFLFGGTNGTAVFGDVWRLTAGPTPSWTQLIPSGTPPSARRRATLVYDAPRDRLLVFGGYAHATSVGTPLTDLWALGPLSGSPAWQQLTPGGSPPFGLLYGTQGVHDAARDRLLIVDGAGSVWPLALAGGTSWGAPLATAGLLVNSGGYDFSLAYDPARDRLLAYGGWWDGGFDFDGVSVFPLSGAGLHAWQPLELFGALKPAARSLAAACYDPATSSLLVTGGRRYFGGTLYGDTWELQLGAAGVWRQLSPLGTLPTARFGHTAVFDAASERALAFGGTGAGGSLGELQSLSWDWRPPSRVVDLQTTIHCQEIEFYWSAPGDDWQTGPAIEYEIRRLSTPLGDGNWDAGQLVLWGTSAAPGAVQSDLLTLGPCSSRYYYAVRVRDEGGTWSPTSNNTGRIGTPCPGPGQFCDDLEYAGRLAVELSVTGGNPLRGRATVQFTVPAGMEGQSYDLSLFDVAGRRVERLGSGPAVAGRHTVSWESSSRPELGAGVYFLRYRLGETTLTRSVVLMK